MKINCKTVNCKNAVSGAGPAAASRRGIALVITLIMLSVTLVMAIAFLALSRRERSAVSTGTDTIMAKLAADSALNAAQAQIMANILNPDGVNSLTNGLYNFSLLVSTNYYSSYGFAPGFANPTNVNFDHYYNSPSLLSPGPLSVQADFVQNVANLEYLPRVPVFIQNSTTGSNEFRFYLDLNRNGQFDDTGNGVSYVDSTGATNGSLSEVGDPQWIGVLARPDAVHSATNQFISRYAFIAVPVGNALDINAIHNQTLNPDLGVLADGFFRNQGVGSWEINLAAFLADLNVNQWDPPTPENTANNPYVYNQISGSGNTGVAFEDAFSILTNRYAGFYNTLAVPWTAQYNVLVRSNIDGYTIGRPMITTELPILNAPNNGVNTPWAGSDNTNRFYDLPSDIFNPANSSSNFTNRLALAGNGNHAVNPSTYDRYTFYRMMSQLGTDSDPDDGKMNLNFRNVVNGTVVPGMETNYFSWTPLDFFTNAADRMLRLYTTNWFYANPSNYLSTYYSDFLFNNNYSFFYPSAYGTNRAYDPSGFGLTNISTTSLNTSHFMAWTNVAPGFSITNIPVYVNGQFVYSPAVNRILQMAANLYDASTNSFYPSVFRPIFEHDNLGNIFIVGYTNLSAGLNTVSGLADLQLGTPYPATALTNWGGNYIPMYTNGNTSLNVYGVPWIIGAKKGFPNFNKFGMQTVVQVTRKLQVQRSTTPTVVNSTTFLTNQLIAFGISNYLNSECWNSYSNIYQNPIRIYAQDTISMSITNNIGAPASFFYNYQLLSNTLVPRWPGFTNNGSSTKVAVSFTNPLSGTAVLLTNSDFYFGSSPLNLKGFYADFYNYGWESNLYTFPFPQFGLTATNQFQLYMLDESSGVHVIDYVQFDGPRSALNITQTIESNNVAAAGYGAAMWSQALNNRGLPYGIANQISASETAMSTGSQNYWANDLANQAQIQGFAVFMGLTPGPYPSIDLSNPNSLPFTTNYIAQAPYTPTATITQYTSWQANDPLVHYLANDLTFSGVESTGIKTGVNVSYGVMGYNMTYPAFSVVNDRYQPWGIQTSNSLPQGGVNGVVESPYGLAYKDPLVWESDYWGFPTNLYPTVGWMGRVHRGTPWQTVYLKAHDVLHVLTSTNLVDRATGTNTWANWTGDNNLFDLANSAPVQDRFLFDLFTTRFNDNAVRGTLSVNQTNLAAWSAMLSGMVVLTNTETYSTVSYPAGLIRPTTNTWMVVQPSAVNGLLQAVVTNINFARANTNLLYNLSYGYTNADGVWGSFEHAGDILSVPAFTEYSPFLNWTNTSTTFPPNLQQYGISDATYEWLPQQMMGLVRGSSTPRYVIYCYGQALRPAPGGMVNATANFGLITNYQVVAESAVRAVVTVQKQVNMNGSWPVTNYTTKVESYSVLPPN